MARKGILEMDVRDSYQEESVKVPFFVTLVVLALVSAPIVYWMMKINDEGSRSANFSNYDALVEVVNNDVRMVDAMLRNDAEALSAIRSSRGAPMVTLIVPDVVIVQEKRSGNSPEALKVTLEGIYWNPVTPLVGMNGETYRVGDVIQGYEITRIGKTSVQFQGPDGSIEKRGMYDGLLQ